MKDEQLFEQIKKEAPEFCHKCGSLKIGTDTGQFGKEYPGPFCLKLKQILNKKMPPWDCIPELEPMCRDCWLEQPDQIGICHFQGWPEIDKKSVEICKEEIEAEALSSKIAGIMLSI